MDGWIGGKSSMRDRICRTLHGGVNESFGKNSNNRDRELGAN